MIKTLFRKRDKTTIALISGKIKRFSDDFVVILQMFDKIIRASYNHQ